MFVIAVDRRQRGEVSLWDDDEVRLPVRIRVPEREHKLVVMEDFEALWVKDGDVAVEVGPRVHNPHSCLLPEWVRSRRECLVDPEGHEWTFGTYAPGQAWS